MSTILEITTVPYVRRLYLLAFLTAAISGTFCVLLTGCLAWNYFETFGNPNRLQLEHNPNEPSYRQSATDAFNLLPTNTEQFIAEKQALLKDKSNEELKATIRQYDRQLRYSFFHKRFVAEMLAPFLLFFAVIFFLSMRVCGVLKRKLPDSVASGIYSETKYPVIAFSMLFAGVSAGLFLTPSTPLESLLREAGRTSNTARIDETAEKTPTIGNETLTPVADVPLHLQWTSFRNGSGIAATGAESRPLTTIAWKTGIPLPGKSSPIVYGNKLFLTGADERQQYVYCFDTETGTLLWGADATTRTSTVKVSEDTGFAAPTPATDGQCVFAMFANGEIVAVSETAENKPVITWRKSFGVPESTYGYAASPCVYKAEGQPSLLIVQFDIGDGSEPKSYITALDCKTGKTVWETRRECPNSWASPVIAGSQLVTCSDPFVIAYHPADGRELWRCKCLSADVGPSPIVSGSVVLVTNQSPRTTAIDATGSGDVTQTHILWQGTNALPDTPSPVAWGGKFFTLDSGGYLTMYDPKEIKNKKAAFAEFEIGGGEASFYSSPAVAGDLMYVFSKTENKPKCFIVDLTTLSAEPDQMKITELSMPEPVVSSPAIVNNVLYVRGTKTLFCLKQ